MSNKIGELLLKQSLITREQLEEALKLQRQTGGKIGSILVKQGIISERELLQFLSEQFNVPAIKLSEFKIDPAVLKLIPVEVAKKYSVMPVALKNSTILVAMVDPTNIFAIDDIKFLTGYRVEPMIASENAVTTAIDTYYQTTTAGLESLLSSFDTEGVEYIDAEDEVDVKSLAQESQDAPVIKLVNAILADAVEKRASDIHIEPYEKVFRIRFRIDGSLYEVMKPPIKMKNAIVSRIKIMSRLDIAERRLPQDGRIKLKMAKGKEMDFRVSVLPTLFGEKVVLRLLDKSNLQLDMTKLGFDPQQLRDFQDAIHRPYGMVLVTGPTGSGKTTTLYSALAELNKTTENISTAEDPVEFNLEGINQVQIHEEIGLTFAAALRSFLRQDPDIILVGEIRDFETAEIAIKAALTGHLVLSTLHTNDAPSTVNRLLNMGVEPFLVSSSINLILAQRLARKICPDCKEPRSQVPEELLEKLGPVPEGFHTATLYKGAGCDSCNGTGYRGRIALYEVMPMTETIKELVLQGASAIDIKREAMRAGMKTLRQSGIARMIEGITTLEEVLKATARDD
ncbi:MAG: type IV-A pilus assembly ATPase PilB [Desulfobacterota bacterium]|nr:type IV-A pilus assembly ATPase PilB [Thermodesulfobacteriota bacterium]